MSNIKKENTLTAVTSILDTGYIRVVLSTGESRRILLSDLKKLVGDELEANTTINLDNTMTTPEIQALIDAVPKNLGGYTLTFQFADGSYTITQTIDIEGYYNGYVEILGNSADATLNATKSVILVGSNDVKILNVIDCQNLTVQYIEFNGNLITVYNNPIIYLSNIQYLVFNFNAIEDATASNYGNSSFDNCMGKFLYNVITYLDRGIQTSGQSLIEIQGATFPNCNTDIYASTGIINYNGSLTSNGINWSASNGRIFDSYGASNIALTETALNITGATTIDLNSYSQITNFKLTLTGNATLTFSNMKAGRTGYINVVQDASSVYTLSYTGTQHGDTLVEPSGTGEIDTISFIMSAIGTAGAVEPIFGIKTNI